MFSDARNNYPVRISLFNNEAAQAFQRSNFVVL